MARKKNTTIDDIGVCSHDRKIFTKVIISISLVTDANGVVVSEMRYTAYGDMRYENGINATDYTYTGQYSNVSDFGLMYYNARWYDPALATFTQPDSIIPDPNNPQDYNRYAYVLNNPLKYTDPTGHCNMYAMENGLCTPEELKESTRIHRSITKIATSYEGDYEWKNPTDNDFYRYFMKNEGNFYEIETMNCWETVLKAAYEAGQIDRDWIEDFYNTAMSSDDPNETIWDQLGAFGATSIDEYDPVAGDVIFFTIDGEEYLGHVALSLGENESGVAEVVSLWSGPNNINSVQITTTDDIVDMMKNLFGRSSVSVTAGHWPPFSE